MCAMLPVACGLSLAAQLKEERSVALAFVGEGATREGDFHEALNLAAVWKLPSIFVVENNGYALSTPLDQQMAVKDVAEAAAGYGMPGEVIDGNDVLAVIETVKRAAERGRQGDGPTLIEAKTFRVRGHEEASGTKYVPQELQEYWAKKDPVDRFVRQALEDSALTKVYFERLSEELDALVDEAAEYALAQPTVTGSAETERRDVFALPQYLMVPPVGGQTEKRFIDAVSDGLRQAMDRDNRVL